MDEVKDLRADGRTSMGAKLQQLMKQVPGFEGYLERSKRRNADNVQREYLIKLMSGKKREIQDLGAALLDGGDLAQMNAIDGLTNVIDRISNKMRAAGTAGGNFFALQDVDTELLDRIYEHDLALISEFNAIADKLGTLQQAVDSNDNVKLAVRGVNSALTEFEARVDGREKILKGLD